MRLTISATLVAAVLLSPIPVVSSTVSSFGSLQVTEKPYGRKTVSVSANSEGEAFARAEKENRGWKAISAKKISKNPKSRLWQVKMIPM